MENTAEIITHFNFTQTRKSKQYLISFFNQKSFNKKQTLYVQQKLKLFLDNFQIINSYEIKENRVSAIQKFWMKLMPANTIISQALNTVNILKK